jgi:hypothetical protein
VSSKLREEDGGTLGAISVARTERQRVVLLARVVSKHFFLVVTLVVLVR